MHLHNERNFPQAKLDSELNARFLSNKHGNLYFFSLLNNSVHVILFNLNMFKKLSEGKNIRVKECTKPLLWDANYDRLYERLSSTSF